MTEVFSNFAIGTLGAPITASQTTISISPITQSNVPSGSPTFPATGNFRIVVQSFDVTTQIPTSSPEIMLVTAVNGKQFTVQRAAESSTLFPARAFPSGAQVVHIITAGVMTALEAGGGGGVSSFNGTTGAITLNAGTGASITQSGLGTYTISATGGTGAVSSVSNSDGTLTISPTTGAVVAGINLANPNIWTAQQEIQLSTFGGTPTFASSALYLQNPTSAALGAQQISPPLVMEGQDWLTTSSVSTSTRFYQYVLPVQGTTTATGDLTFAFQAGNGTIAVVAEITSGGSILAIGALGSNQTTNGNFYMVASITSASQVTAQSLFAGASGVNLRTQFYGSTSTLLTAGNSYGGVVFANAPTTTAASGTHAMLANVVIKAIGTITQGASTVTRTASLYIDGPPTATVTDRNYAAYYSSGAVSVNGTLCLNLSGLMKANGSNNDITTAVPGTDYGTGSQVVTTTPFTAPATALPTYYAIKNSTGGAFTFNLPASPATGQLASIVDALNNAGTNNITVSGNGKTISAYGSTQASVTIASNGGSLNPLVYDGTQWNCFG
jgi:hypothetical protein